MLVDLEKMPGGAGGFHTFQNMLGLAVGVAVAGMIDNGDFGHAQAPVYAVR
jgi:hypothetical protein